MSVLARLWSLRGERPMLVVVASGTLLIVAAYPFIDWWLRTADIASTYTYHDFGVFRAAVDRWQTGEALYQQADDGGYHGSYLYPPIVLPLFVPFAGLSYWDAGAAWNLASLGLLWVALQLVIDAVGYRLRRWERAGLLWLLVGFQPLSLSMKLGQIAPFLAALLCFALVALLRDQDGNAASRYVSGIVTALVGTIKLAYLPVGTHLLHDRDRLLGAIGAGGALVFLSLLLFGIDTHRAYLDVLVWGVSRGGESRPPTLWLPGFYRPLHWLPAAQWLRAGGCLVVAGVAFTARRSAAPLVFALGVTAFPLLTPIAYTYYFVALLPAVVVLLAAEIERDGHMTAPIVALLLVHLHALGLKFVVDWLPSLFPPMELFAPYWILQPGLWGNLVLFGLALLRVSEASTVPQWIANRRWDRRESKS